MNRELLNKIKNCKTEDEAMKIVKENMDELSELGLEMVLGGSNMTLEDFEEKQKQEQEDREIMNLLLELFQRLTDTDNIGEIKIG